VLILIVAASLGLMALYASAAQAATWMVNGTNVTSKLSIGETDTAENGKITLLSKVLGMKFALSCEKLEFLNAAFEPGGVETGEFFWKTCKVKLGEKEEESAACKPKEPIDLNEKAKGEKVEGQEDEEFVTSATIEFPNEECVFSGKLPLTGTWWMVDCENTWGTEKLVHLVQESMSAALARGGLKLENEPAFIDGSINMEINDGGPKKFSALF